MAYAQSYQKEEPISAQGGLRSRNAGEIQVVEFILGTQMFAIELADTKEVINQTDITPLPEAPPYIRGIINLRGIVTTILDLKSLMHVSGEAEQGHKKRVIILDSKISSKMIGVLVDDVLSVTTYKTSFIDRDDSSSEHAKNRLGVIRKKVHEAGDKERSELVILVNIEAIIKKIEANL